MVRVSVEAARGCGYRKPGGLYLVAPALAEACPRLPIEMTSCPTCGAGIRPARGWTWIAPPALIPAEVHGSPVHNAVCPLGGDIIETGEGASLALAITPHRCGERAGLLWIGEGFYPMPSSFTAEAAKMGVSRRITAVPRGFVTGKTYVFAGHRRALRAGYSAPDGTHYGSLYEALAAGGTAAGITADFRPGIISVFRPTAIEYILRPGEEKNIELLEGLEKRGIEPVQVIRAEQETLALEAEGGDE